MVEKDGNIWASSDWPKMVPQHVIDLYKAPETELMAEKSELENLSHGAMKNGGHARAVEARATLDMALEHTKRSCTPEEYDEQLVTRKSVNLDWSTMLYFCPPRQARNPANHLPPMEVKMCERNVLVGFRAHPSIFRDVSSA